MQNVKLYRRGVVVPLDKTAEESIFNNNVDKNTAIDYYKIPNESVFEGLWEKGLFTDINHRLGIMIDDYEEEIIRKDQINSLKEILVQFDKKNKLSLSEKLFIKEFMRLCDIALIKKLSLLVIL